MQRYKPYEPTAWEQRIDAAIRLVAPKAHFNRTVSRERSHYFRYLAALPNSARRNASQHTSGETIRGSREKQQVMWNAINMVDNSGLGSSIISKLQSYVCGLLRWQARTGDKAVNDEYEDAMRMKLSKALDYTGRFSLRQMCMLDIKGILVKGDIGTNIVREGPELYLQGIEADRIGNPNEYRISNNYIRGLEIDDNGRIQAARIYRRDRAAGTYKYDDTFQFRDKRGLPSFLFLVSPISYDDYRGVSSFKTAIDNSTYIDRMREYELQAMLWASTQSGVYHTTSGELPEKLPFDNQRLVDASGNYIDTYQVRPNTVTALGLAEKVEMFPHERPSPNVIAMYNDTRRDICIGAGVSFAFGCGYDELTGPGVRAVSSQDARAIEVWQWLLRESKLDPIMTLMLGNSIANGELPYHPNWMKWEWFFPSKSTIDVGRESAANIEEIEAGINTGAKVAADDGQDIDEIKIQRGKEIESEIEIAMEIAKNLSKGEDTIDWREVYMRMNPMRGKAGMAKVMGPGQASEDGPGATSGGVAIDEGGSNNGSKKNGFHGRALLDFDTGEYHEFYSPDQLRDQGGKFADEGKGAEGPGYKHPDEAGLTGIDKKLVDYVAHRPLDRSTSNDVRSIRKYAPGMHYVAYSKVPFFKQLNKLQGTPDVDKVPVEEFAAARKKLFKEQPVERLKIKGLIATQPVINKDKVKRNVKEEHVKDISVVEYNGRHFVMDGHHALAAAARLGDKHIDAHVLKLGAMRGDGPDHKFYREDQARDAGRFADEGKGSEEPGYKHPGEGGGNGKGEGKGGMGPLTSKGKTVGEPLEGRNYIEDSEDSRLIMEHYGGDKVYKIHTGSNAVEFFSPSTEDMTFDQALKAMKGSPQIDAHLISGDIDNHLHLDSTAHDGIGDWNDGAENSIVHEIDDVADFDELRYSAALKGAALNQKAVLAFMAGDGEDAIHRTTVPTDNLQEIRERLTKAGIQHRTLLPDGKNTHIMTYDQGNKLGSNLSEVAKQYGSKVETIRGCGEFVGESETRYGAITNYSKIIEGYEEKFPNRGHYGKVSGKGVHDNRRKVTVAAGKPYKEVNPPYGPGDIHRYTADLMQSVEVKSINDKLNNLALQVKSKRVFSWSIEKNSGPDGKLTPAREAHQNKIVRDTLNSKAAVPEGETPTLTLLIGAPGSGKTKAGVPYIEKNINKENTYISPDAVREQLPETEPWNTPATQDEVRSITQDKLLPAAMKARHNVILDITGSTFSTTEEMVNVAGSKGYNVKVVHVQVPIHIAMKRAMERWYEEGKQTGRFTSPDYISEYVDHKPDKTYDALKKNPYVKSWIRLDNSGKTVKTTDEGSKE